MAVNNCPAKTAFPGRLRGSWCALRNVFVVAPLSTTMTLEVPMHSPCGASRVVTALAFVAIAATAFACNDYPITRLNDSLHVRVNGTLDQTNKVKIDVLWVVDNSPSMASELRQLASGYSKLVDGLGKLGQVDLQMAVITTQQTPELSPSGVKVVGKFQSSPGAHAGIAAAEKALWPCLTNSHCAPNKALAAPASCGSASADSCPKSLIAGRKLPPGPVGWRCKAPASASQLFNTNCSVNSHCIATCKTDADCRQTFQPHLPASEQTAVCKPMSGQPNFCEVLPPTAHCPPANKLPGVITNQTLDLFPCVASVGLAQSQEAAFEGGFRAVWEALNPDGPNCSYDACVKAVAKVCKHCAAATATWCGPLKNAASCQNTKLLRPDAWLLIVFVSDDDDASLRHDLDPRDKSVVTREQWAVAQTLGDSLAGNAALNDGWCAHRRDKAEQVGKDIWCADDCMKGSEARTVAGLLKCPGGCNADSPEHLACLAKYAETGAKLVRTAANFPPVSDWVVRLKSLKKDPGRVLVAALAGDTVCAPASAHAARAAYYRSVFRNAGPGQVPSVCAGAKGGSRFLGERYREFVASFRDNGKFLNLCAETDLAPSLAAIADKVVTRVRHICLPEPPPRDASGTPQIRVALQHKGTRTSISRAAAADASQTGWHLGTSARCRPSQQPSGLGNACAAHSECDAGAHCNDGTCALWSGAMYFTRPLPADAVVEIGYDLELGF